MKFKFKLETVLQVKIRQEELRKKEMNEAELNRSRIQQQLDQCRQDVVETVQLYREKMNCNLNLSLANQYNQYIAWLTKQVKVVEHQLTQAEKAVETARQHLIEAAKEKKVLEKLKEKAYQDYLAEESRIEVSFLDELGTGRFMRARMSEQEVHK